jgi:hypothetical protein
MVQRLTIPMTLAVVAVASGCAATIPRFPLAEPMWEDDDRQPFGPKPEAWYSPFFWDGADHSVFRPLAELWWLELDHEAINVNAFDEVPGSSWYTNRLARGALSPAEVALGACATTDEEVPFPLTITRGKPDGASPGFFVRDAAGVTYLLKLDDADQPERGSASDAISAAIFHAAGYFTPCNRVIRIRREDLLLAPDAEIRLTSGHRRPLTRERVDRILASARTSADGTIRVGVSQFIDGEPIAPWTYSGTWDADPNDVVPHEERRDVRAMYVLSSWVSHIDSRQENTLASWIETGEDEGYVRHYMIDFSDTLGITRGSERLSRRFGHSGYVDVQHIAEDLLTLGAISRPWDSDAGDATSTTLGYFDAARYQPDRWRPGYPNPAYDRMTERDAAWMARILARFGDAHVRALVARGRFSEPAVARELEQTLIARRDRALERWLTRLSPLARPVLRRPDLLCLEDLAISGGIRQDGGRRYAARGYVGDRLEPHAAEIASQGEGRVCVWLPRAAGASAARPSYLVLEIVASTAGRETAGPLRLHAYDVGDAIRIVALERPSTAR